MAFEKLADIEQIEMAEESEEYKTFTEKFKPKHTTDDCYTPDNVFEAVRAWVFKRYELQEDTQVIRPFYPGGDYKREEYPEGCVVIDNPPFSIMAQIVDWYNLHGVHYFIFANGLTCGSIAWTREGVTAVVAGSSITFANGANISINFLTNMSPEILTESVPELHEMLEEIEKKNCKEQKKKVTRLQMPDEIVTAARMNYLATHNTPWQVKRGSAAFIRKLDNYKSGIFGGGLLLSEEAAAERAAAERAAAERAAALRVPLSEREKEIVRSLGQ